jgi:hypothetical protein
MTDWTHWEFVSLALIARTYLRDIGKPPATIKELADFWYEFGNRLAHPPEARLTVAEVDRHHIPDCIWLRELEKRADAPALLTQALDMVERGHLRATRRITNWAEYLKAYGTRPA